MSDILARTEAVLERIEQSTWESCILDQGQGYAALDAMVLRGSQWVYSDGWCGVRSACYVPV